MTDCPEPKPSFEAAIRPDEKLIGDGWVRRFLADPDRAKEALELYGSMGFEVRAEKLKPDDFDDKCGDCPALVCKSYVMIYTRKRDG